jgi:uncharacterized protein YyaL (SSP411 family)
LLKEFADPVGGGFYYTAADHEQLIARNKELTDSSTPSGNGLAATALLRLGELLGRSDYLDAAESAMAAALPIMERAPTAAGQMLLALDRFVGPSHELVLMGDLSGEEMKQAIKAIQQRFLPRTVLAVRDGSPNDPTESRSRELEQIFAGKESQDGQPTLYVCQNFTCQRPVVGLAAIEAALVELNRQEEK